MRAIVRLRELLLSNADLARKLNAIPPALPSRGQHPLYASPLPRYERRTALQASLASSGQCVVSLESALLN